MATKYPDLGVHVLAPTAKELRRTRVLFYSKHATDQSRERIREFGYTVVTHGTILGTLRQIGLDVTAASDPAILFGDLDFDFIYFTQFDAPFEGHELLIPCIAAMRGIPFLGPSAPVRALSEDKVLGKAFAASLGIEVARERAFDPLSSETASRPGSWVIKPRNGVMSEGVMFADSEASWREAARRAADPLHCGRAFMAEEFVPGLNLAVPVVEGLPARSLPVFVEKCAGPLNLLTEAAKEGRNAEYSCRPYRGPGAEEAQAAAERLAAAMAPFDYARFDFRYDEERARLVFLEVNMNAALGPYAVVPRAAELYGIDYASLVGHIFTHSLRRQRARALRSEDRASSA